MREVMAIADRANQYIDDRKPWVLVKDGATREEVQDVCTVGLNLFRVIMTFLKPVLPRTAERVESFLRCGELSWDGIASPLLGHRIARFEPLLTRVEPARIDAMVADSMETEEGSAPPTGAGERARETGAPPPGADDDSDGATSGGTGGRIDVSEFAKVDLRIGKILGATHVEGADKLLELRVDVGDEERTVFAGDPCGVLAGEPHRPARSGRRQSRASQDAVRCIGWNDPRGRLRRLGHLAARCGRGRAGRNAGEVRDVVRSSASLRRHARSRRPERPRPPAGSDHRHGYRRRGCRGRPPAPDPVRPVRLRRLPAVCASPGARRRGRQPLPAGRGGHHRGARPHPGDVPSRRSIPPAARQDRARPRSSTRARASDARCASARARWTRSSGARRWMHAVLESECTGCGLCIEPCPVDCISMVPARTGPATPEGWLAERAPLARQRFRAPLATGIGVRRGAAPAGSGRAGSMPSNP